MSDRILSPTESDVGREMGGVTLLKLVDCRSNNRALWVWRVRADGCGPERNRWQRRRGRRNEAALGGWRVLRVTGAMVKDGRALRTIERPLQDA